MKLVQLKLIIILHTIIGTIFITSKLISADISKYHTNYTSAGASAAGSGSSADSEPRPGTRAYYRHIGCDYAGTPSRASLIEQTAELGQFLASTSVLFVAPNRATRKFVPYDTLLIVVSYSQPDDTITKHLEVTVDFFSNYCAITPSKRNGERDFAPEDQELSINPYSNQYRFLTTNHHYQSSKNSIITEAPPFSSAWLRALKDKSRNASVKRTISATEGPVELPPAQFPRPTSPPVPPAAESLSTHPKPIAVMARSPAAPPIAITERPRHELATAANTMARLQEFKQLPSIWIRRTHGKAGDPRKR